MLPHFLLTTAYTVNTIILPIVQMRRLRFREVPNITQLISDVEL